MTSINKNYLGIGLVGLAIIVFWVLFMPILDNVSLLNNAIAEKEDMLSARVSIFKKIEEINTKYQQRSEDVNKISSVIPNKKSPAELVSTIETMAQQSGLQLLEMTTGGSKKEGQDLQTIPVEIGLTGSYLSLGTFLELVEKNIRLLDVFELSISQMAAPGGQIVLNFRIKINAYYLIVK